MVPIKKFFIFSILFIFLLVSPIFSEPLIYSFVKNISGKRDFYIQVDINFDVVDNQKNNFKTNISLEATIVNLENFDIRFLKPDFLSNIEINYNLVNNISVYKYDGYTNSEVSNFTLDKINEIFKTAAGFLTSTAFTVNETENGVSFLPTGYLFLKRLGLEPTKINVHLNDVGFDEIIFSTDDSTETVVIKFKEFKVLDIK
ncbi:MAG: hypothetical protein PWP54_605 [Thermosipho sp. (in: thermotogales)]|nr:hypothetical protein [Thermosipho sp. (in: thermotogales)]MDN5324876.1 hypothetical protein [Thermosipho sp. (in: thermotogales)]